MTTTKPKKPLPDGEETLQRRERSQWGEVWHRLRKNKGAMLGLSVVLLLIFIALFSGVFLDYETQVVGQNTANRLQSPSLHHLMGTDEYGRDVFARILYGTKYSLSVGFVAVSIALVCGVFWARWPGSSAASGKRSSCAAPIFSALCPICSWPLSSWPLWAKACST